MLLLADAEQAGGLVDVAAVRGRPLGGVLAGWPDDRRRPAPGCALPPELTGGRSTVGLRLPDHSSPRALAASLGPLPVTSANVSGLPEASDAVEIRDQLGDAIDLILDGGAARGGPPSTVVDCSAPTPRILRDGAIVTNAIRRALAEAGLPGPER